MLRNMLILLLPVLLAACAAGDSGQPTPTTAPFTSDVTVVQPQAGTVIYAEAVRVSGTVNGEAAQTLRIVLVDADAEILASSILDAAPGEWSVELPHGYQGEPAAIDLLVQPNGEDTGADYARIPLTFADITHRPDGAFASIRFPSEGDALGGDTVLVEGSVSGVRAITVTLLDANDEIIDAREIDLSHEFAVDEVPWQVELSPGGYAGAARVEVLSNDDGSVLAAVTVTLDLAAG